MLLSGRDRDMGVSKCSFPTMRTEGREHSTVSREEKQKCRAGKWET